MSSADKYASLMEKGDNLWYDSFKSDGKGSKRRKKAKKLYRKAEIIKIEAGAKKVDQRNITVKPTYNSNKFNLFGSLFGFHKKK